MTYNMQYREKCTKETVQLNDLTQSRHPCNHYPAQKMELRKHPETLIFLLLISTLLLPYNYYVHFDRNHFIVLLTNQASPKPTVSSRLSVSVCDFHTLTSRRLM